MSYNGWTNHETWLVNVWYNPESREDVLIIRETLESQWDDMPDGLLKDMCRLAMSDVNWEELLEHFEESEEESEEV